MITDTELDKRLTDVRSTPHWPADERDAILEGVLAASPVHQLADRRLLAAGRHRRRTVAALVALAAAACVAVPALIPSGSPGSADRAAADALHRLAHVAAVTPGPADQLKPGQFVHYVETDHQKASPGQSAGTSRYEYWIAGDGRTWQRRDERNDDPNVPGEHAVWLLPPGDLDSGYPATATLDQLPTDPDALESYLRQHTSGSTSPDERVFVAIQLLVSRGLPSAQLRSAAIEVLAQLGHVRLGEQTRDSQGRPVQEFNFVDPQGRPNEVQALLFDPRTARNTEQLDYIDGQVFNRSSITNFSMVDAVPATIRRDAVLQN